MAIWQVSFFVIPQKNSKCNLSSEKTLSWGQQSTSIEKIDFLEKEESWTNQISQYGRDDETCIEFFYEDGSLLEISCRLDLRSLTKDTLIKILKYIKSIDGLILFENKLYEADMNRIIEILKNSEANKFCKSPENYFNRLSSKKG